MIICIMLQSPKLHDRTIFDNIILYMLYRRWYGNTQLNDFKEKGVAN